jgi:protein SCO1/2
MKQDTGKAITKAAAAVLAGLVMLAFTAATAVAEDDSPDPHAAHRAMLQKPAADATASSDIRLVDKLLTTSHGEEVRFASDVIADHIVVMDFVYTTCTTICPALSAIMQQVQAGLGDRLGADVRLISITVDPVRDTPARLRDYAARLRAAPDWLWLTGEKGSVDDVLHGLGAYSPNFEDHPSIVLVGDPQNGTWKRFFGFPGSAKILAAVDELAAARQIARNQP